LVAIAVVIIFLLDLRLFDLRLMFRYFDSFLSWIFRIKAIGNIKGQVAKAIIVIIVQELIY
jgi:hypothetical protein